MLWQPDTCEPPNACQLLLDGEDFQETLETCDAHKGLDGPEHLKALLQENRSKNEMETKLLTLKPDLESVSIDKDGAELVTRHFETGFTDWRTLQVTVKEAFKGEFTDTDRAELGSVEIRPEQGK